MKYLKNIKPRTIEAVHTHTHTHTHTDNFKNIRGITLIALVITIIVLLVLSGATFAMISGENGILKKVIQAKESTEKASVEERIRLAIQSALSSDYNAYGRITRETLISELEKNDLLEDNLEVIEDGKWVLSKNGEEYLIYSDGNLEIKKGKLPIGYKELEYIESTGTQYIDTGVVPNQDTCLEIDYEPSTYSAFSGLKLICGARDSDYPSSTFFFSGTYNTIYMTYGTNDRQTFQVPNGRHVLKNLKNKIYVDDILKNTYSEQSFTLNSSLLIFTGRCPSTNPNHLEGNIDARFSQYKLYNFKMYDDTNIIKNFIPCINPQGKIGMFDTVTQTFFGNQGTGTFITGPEVN